MVVFLFHQCLILWKIRTPEYGQPLRNFSHEVSHGRYPTEHSLCMHLNILFPLRITSISTRKVTKKVTLEFSYRISQSIAYKRKVTSTFWVKCFLETREFCEKLGQRCWASCTTVWSYDFFSLGSDCIIIALFEILEHRNLECDTFIFLVEIDELFAIFKSSQVLYARRHHEIFH